jgi:hypothetical protein
VVIKEKMKKIILIILTAPMFAFGQDTLSVNNDQRAFCLNVIKSIIEHNCAEYFESISDSVVLYHSVRDTIVSKSELKPQLMGLCNASVKNDLLDYQYYLDNFKIQFYDVNDIAEKIGRGRGDEESNLSTLNYYQIKVGDIFFQGAYHKTRNRMDFILDDAFKFVFRKIDGVYKIIVITP